MLEKSTLDVNIEVYRITGGRPCMLTEYFFYFWMLITLNNNYKYNDINYEDMEFEYESSDEVSDNRDVDFWSYSSELEDWESSQFRMKQVITN